MRLEVALLSIPFAFCLSLFALRASIATRSSKGVSLSLRTIAYPFFICKSSLSFFLTILYQKSRDFSNVRKCRGFKSRRLGKGCKKTKEKQTPYRNHAAGVDIINSAGIVYHQPKGLYIIKTKFCMLSIQREMHAGV